MPRIPYLTVALAVVCTAFSVIGFNQVNQYTHFMVNSKEVSEFQGAHTDYVIDLCLRHWSREICRQAVERWALRNQYSAMAAYQKIHERLAPTSGRRDISAEPDSSGWLNNPGSLREVDDYLHQMAVTSDAQIKTQAQYASLPGKKERWLTARSKIQAELGLLSKSTLAPLTLLRAQFLHGGTFHLLGNLLMLIVFGAFVEQALSRWAYLMIYFLGGSIGLALELLLPVREGHIVLGASANIAALMGAFYVLFFKYKMRYLFTFMFVYFKTIRLPVAWTIPLFFILGDIIGTLGYGQSTSGIAHAAHLGGLAMGLGLGYLLRDPFLYKNGFLYPDELRLFQNLKKKQGLEVIRGTKKLLGLNPENTIAMENAIASLMNDEKLTQGSRPDSESHRFLSKWLPRWVSLQTGAQDFSKLEAVFSNFPQRWSLANYLKSLSAPQLIKLGDLLLRRNQPIAALRIYDAFLKLYPGTRSAQDVEKTCINIVEHQTQVTGQNETFQSWLKDYSEFHPNSFLASLCPVRSEGMPSSA